MDEYEVTRRATLSGDVSMEIPAEGPIVVRHASTVTVEDLAPFGLTVEEKAIQLSALDVEEAIHQALQAAEAPFLQTWKHEDEDGDVLRVEDYGTFLAVTSHAPQEIPVHLEVKDALDLGQRLIAWARAQG